MSAPGPWHEVEMGHLRFRWRETEVGLDVDRWYGTDGWASLPHCERRAFALGYHARRDLVATLVAMERHGAGGGS